MDIEALRAYIAFVDTGSFTRAAKQTFRTQSAISMQMKKLEDESGQSLFRKNGRYLELTDSGRVLVSYARRIIAMHDEALGMLVDSGQQPALRIGCPDDYAESVLPEIVALLTELVPTLSIRIVCDCSTQLRLMLDNGDLDLAILTRSPEKEEGYLLKHDTGVWVHGGFEALLKRPVLPLILYEADCKYHSASIDGLEKRGRAFQLFCATPSATVIKNLLRKGLGVSAMARSSLSVGLVELTSDQSDANNLPPLPAVDIVLSVAPKSHPLMGVSQAAELCERFRQRDKTKHQNS
ncbi:LysR substrate-binding domain-containing protein [Neptunomonas phycophila]|uniref:LysR substrate-binding domain-containing protein n=1 Tax=Neptunomonas phycophila TaxID=1572645 RepID=UPI0015BEBA55|nr:LysR substrate-binding domain-containing protein [Neptunomonas phycophila]MDO6467501.1 LysR substrate-binding domain-containing protein [Neptunomonas phycophila]QLE98483.1 LysR family transcriptional regulator [Neptunomonas phycophila]